MLIAWILSLPLAFLLGYFLRTIKDDIKNVKTVVETVKLPDPEPVAEEPKSKLVDPLDPLAEAEYQREQLIKDINPDI